MAISEAHVASVTSTTAELSLTGSTAGTTVIQSQTTDGIYQLWVDFNAAASGDEFRIIAYEKVNAGTQRIAYQTNLVGPQSPPLFVLPSLILMDGWDFTLTRMAGANRTVTASVRKVA